MISGGIKTDVKQQEIKNGSYISRLFLQELPLKLEIQYNKTGMYFSFNFCWFFIQLDVVC